MPADSPASMEIPHLSSHRVVVRDLARVLEALGVTETLLARMAAMGTSQSPGTAWEEAEVEAVPARTLVLEMTLLGRPLTHASQVRAVAMVLVEDGAQYQMVALELPLVVLATLLEEAVAAEEPSRTLPVELVAVVERERYPGPGR